MLPCMCDLKEVMASARLPMVESRIQCRRGVDDDVHMSEVHVRGFPKKP